MTDGKSPESGGRKRGRPRARERVLKVRVPASVIPFLERMGHGSAESGAAVWLASLDREERRIDESISSSLREIAAAARSLKAQADQYEDERRRWLGDLLAIANAPPRDGEAVGGGSSDGREGGGNPTGDDWDDALEEDDEPW